jgi:hypothetical protein
MFETFDNTHYQTDECECRGKGYLGSAVCAMQYHEHNRPHHGQLPEPCTFPCPRGCEGPDEMTLPDEPEVTHPDDMPAVYASRTSEHAYYVSDLMRLKQAFGELQGGYLSDLVDGPAIPAREWSLKPQNTVTSDTPIRGILADRMVTVPAYLCGTPVDLDEFGRTTVDYEYMGSHVQVTYMPSNAAKLRFSHPWDTDLSTGSLMQ